MNVVVDKKENSHLLTTASGDSDSNSKSKTPKLISFSSFIKRVMLNDLGDGNDPEDKK